MTIGKSEELKRAGYQVEELWECVSYRINKLV